MGRGFTSGGQESRSVFSASMCIIQARLVVSAMLSPYH